MTLSSLSAASGSPRYVLERPLGAGGMGRVDLVLDTVRAQRVARKRIDGAGGVTAVRFKAEFRSMERLHHRHLVRLFEMGSDDEGLFFTMEHVDGPDLGAYCDAHAQGDDAIAALVPQLVSALRFLHGHGVAHCDLKPSNVLVARDGTLKVVDFGVLSRIGADAPVDALDRGGTLAYMAPERLAGARPSAATDLFALGVLLKRLYTRRVSPEVTSAPLLAVRPDVAPEIARVVDALVGPRPEERPALDEVADAFGARARSLQIVRKSRAALVGRDAEMERLASRVERVLGGGFDAVAITGASGVGKSALARHAGRAAERAGAVVLHGRARLREAVAFNGLDDAADALVRHVLASKSRAASMAAAAAGAAVLFPALTAIVPPGTPAPVADRVAAFTAFVDLLARVARGAGGLVLVVDDLQWIDGDAAALLLAILRAGPAHVLLLATARDDLPSLGEGAAVLGHRAMTTEKLGPLDEAALAAIVGAEAASLGPKAPSPSDLRELARLAHGRPVLLDLALRALLDGVGSRDPSEALARRLARLGDVELRVVTALVAADGWTDAATLATAIARPKGLVDEALVTLEHQGLVRLGAVEGGARRVDLFHDVVRTAGASTVDEAHLREAHAGLAVAFLARDASDERVVRHWMGAGRPVDAARHALPCAQRAFEKHAYDRAAELWRIALGDPGVDPFDVARRRALAFERAGRYAEAAAIHAELVDRAPPAVAAEARLDEAAALLAAGDVNRGREHLLSALRAIGEAPPGKWARFLSLVRFLLGPRRVKTPRALPPAPPSRDAERRQSIAALLMYFDPGAGLPYMQDAQRRFAATGDAVPASLADAAFAYYSMYALVRGGDVPRARAYRAAAEARLAHLEEPPAPAVAWRHLLDGVEHERAGRAPEGAASFDAAASVLERHGAAGTTYHLLALNHRASIPVARYEGASARGAIDHLVRSAEGRPASVLRCCIDAYAMMGCMIQGGFDEARLRMNALSACWSKVDTHQRPFVALVAAWPAIYVGDPIAARDSIAHALRRDARFRTLSTMYYRWQAGMLALLDARAARAGDRRVTVRSVRRWVDSAAGAARVGGEGAALRALAYVEEVHGASPEAVAERLAQAEAQADAEGAPVHAAIARYQRGERTAGVPGARLRDEARAVIVAAGVSPVILDECPR